MSAHQTHVFRCRLSWTGASHGGTTGYAAYSRTHRIDFDGKPSLAMSAAGAFRGDEALHNPEDLLVASLAACHFLSYAALCARSGVGLVDYADAAEGTMALVDGVMRFREVVLRPRCTIGSGDSALALRLHDEAHHKCFIASSVNFPVRHEPEITVR